MPRVPLACERLAEFLTSSQRPNGGTMAQVIYLKAQTVTILDPSDSLSHGIPMTRMSWKLMVPLLGFVPVFCFFALRTSAQRP